MTQLTQDEIKDELFAIFEEHEDELISYTEKIDKIEENGIELFERKVIAAKNRLIHDTSVSDDDLEKLYLEEIGKIKEFVVTEVKRNVQDLLDKQSKSS